MDFIDHRSTAKFIFKTSATDEKARIDDSGNILTGKTSSNFSTAGAEVRNLGNIWATRDGGVPLALNRLNSDGTIAQFYKDGGSIGVVAAVSGDLAIYSSASGHAGLRLGNGYVASTNNAGTIQNGSISLGLDSYRWEHLWLSGDANIGGNATITGDLTVNGTTTTLNTATLDVEDKNITLNYGAGDTSSTADGAGITIQDAVDASNNATILWDATNDEFDFSHAIDVTGAITSSGSLTVTDFVKASGNNLKFSAGGNHIMNIDLNGKIYPNTDNAVDLGFSATAARFRNLNLTGNITVGGTTVIDSSRNITAGTISAQNNLTIQNSSAYGSIELGGVSGGFIDIKRPFSDDYDLRLISTGDGGVINVASGELTIQRAGSTKLATTTTGVDVTGTAVTDGLTVAGATALTHSGTTLSVDRTGGATALIELQQASTIRGYLGADSTKSLIVFNGSAAEKFSVSNAGIDVTGTVTADGLTISSATANVADLRRANNIGAGQVLLGNSDGHVRLSGTNGSFDVFNSGNTAQRFGVANNGDISFYDSAGSSQSLFWDASTEFLGLGSTTPQAKLDIVDTASDVQMRVYKNDGTKNTRVTVTADDSGAKIHYRDADNAGALRFNNNLGEVMRIPADTTRLGIGTSNPATALEVNGTIGIGRTAGGYTFREIVGGGERASLNSNASNELLFNIGAASEAMRLDSSGNLLVGKTATTFSTEGIVAFSSADSNGSRVNITNDGGEALNLNRKTNDGNIAIFYKDGTTVGSIQSRAGLVSTIILDPRSGSLGTGITGSGANLSPTNGSGTEVDARNDIGTSTYRFKDLYLSGGIKLNTASTADTIAMTRGTNGQNNMLKFVTGSTDDWIVGQRNDGTSDFRFYSYGTSSDAVSITRTGNVLVGTTDTTLFNNSTGGGFSVSSNGFTQIAKQGADSADPVLILNQTGLDGEIQRFYKDGTAVGSIGNDSTALTIGSGSTGVKFGSSAIWATTGGSTNSNGTKDLGASTVRWRDLYLSGYVKANSGYQVGTTTVIDSSRNLTNIGTISSGAITSSGAIVSADNIVIGSGGTYQAGNIYSDSSWGMILRAKQQTPTQADFLFSDYGDNHLVRFDGSYGLRIQTGGLQIGTNTVIDSSRNITAGTISSGVITAEGSSGGENLDYASNFAASGAGIQLTLERKNDSAGWGGIGADNTYCFAAWGGSGGVTRRFAVGQSGNANLLYGGYQINGSTVIDSSRNITAGTISSGAITSSGTVTADGLTVDDTTGTVASFTSNGATTALNLNNTHTNGWGSNIAFQTGGTAAGYFGSIGSLLGNTDQDLAAYSTTGNGFRIYTNGNNERLRIDSSSGNVGIGRVSNSVVRLSVAGTDAGASNYAFEATNSSAATRFIVRNDGQSQFFKSDNSASMTVTSGGNIGIGTSSPSSAVGFDAKLQLESANPMLVYKETDQSTKWEVGAWGGNYVVYNGTSERTRIDASGNQLWGKTAANNTTQGIRFLGSSGFMSVVRSSNTLAVFNRIDSDGTLINFRTNGTTRGSISISGSTTSYNTTSDQRLKRNIEDADNAGAIIDSIQVRKFDWIDGGEHQRYGMVAQELSTVAPEAVSVPDDAEEMQSVDYSKLVPMMLKEIQTLRARVAQLEGEN